jgi:hypothetical protein
MPYTEDGYFVELSGGHCMGLVRLMCVSERIDGRECVELVDFIPGATPLGGIPPRLTLPG